jgi:hypothetical protein
MFMNQEIKKKWCEALRSGYYKQTGGSLCCDGMYCCLGVLCELAVIDGVYMKTDINTEEISLYTYKIYGGCEAELPKEVMIWAGLELDDALVTITNQYGHSTNLADLNDCGVIFDEIADIIEGNL